MRTQEGSPLDGLGESSYSTSAPPFSADMHRRTWTLQLETGRWLDPQNAQTLGRQSKALCYTCLVSPKPPISGGSVTICILYMRKRVHGPWYLAQSHTANTQHGQPWCPHSANRPQSLCPLTKLPTQKSHMPLRHPELSHQTKRERLVRLGGTPQEEVLWESGH